MSKKKKIKKKDRLVGLMLIEKTGRWSWFPTKSITFENGRLLIVTINDELFDYWLDDVQKFII